MTECQTGGGRHRSLFLALGLLALLGSGCATVPGQEATRTDAARVVSDATAAVMALRNDLDPLVFDYYLDGCVGVLIYPNLVRGGLIVGAEGGVGVMMAKDGEAWSAPAFYQFFSGSYGLQAGLQRSSVVLFFMNEQTLRASMREGFTLAGDVSAALGEDSINTEASTAHFDEDIYYFAIAEGAFAGISLEGGALDPLTNLNEVYYGKDVSAAEVLFGDVPVPASVGPLHRALEGP